MSACLFQEPVQEFALVGFRRTSVVYELEGRPERCPTPYQVYFADYYRVDRQPCGRLALSELGVESFPSASSSPANASLRETRLRNGETLTVNPVVALRMK